MEVEISLQYRSTDCLKCNRIETGDFLSKQKFCVFCGQHPIGKTKEHVIPGWLIEMTGNPNRKIDLGLLFSDFIKEGEPKERQISFNSFTFPACKICNEQFGNLEARAKPVVEKLINNHPLSAFDFDILLDWFDKVRIGLWLGYFLYLEANIWQIDPHFFITSRLGKADRALLIYKSAQEFDGVRFMGVNTPAFIHTPSCFTLSINNYFMINVSSQFLLAQKAGFPYLSNQELTENDLLHGVLKPGTEIIDLPLFDFPYDPKCSIIGQVIFTQILNSSKTIDFENIQYVQDHLLEGNRMFPILQKGDALSWCSANPSENWVPVQEHNLSGLITKNVIQTLKIQNYFSQKTPFAKEVSEERAALLNKRIANIVNANNDIISTLLEDQLNI